MSGRGVKSAEPVEQVTTSTRGAVVLSLAIASAFAVAGCATPPPPKPAVDKSYVVLLESPDGAPSRIEYTAAAGGTTTLAKPGQATRLAGAAGNAFELNAAEIDSEFGPTLAATPEPAEHFLIYFETGGSRLTAKSREELPQILASLTKRAAPDISVTGHTDTVGSDASNEALGLQRAKLVADLLGAGRRIPANRISLESHGEKNPLVKTADNVGEPRNRRVEVTVR